MAINKAQINVIKDLNTRNVVQGLYDEIDSLHQTTGTNFLSPANNTQKPASAPPSPGSIAVSGANGNFVATLTPPTQSINKVIYHETSYSPKANFSESVTTMPVTSSPSLVIPSPGTTAYFRARWSYDGVNWSSYSYA
jgi:hypothetical protein